MTHSKYHNRKTSMAGMVFDSAAEAHRYLVLLSDEQAGEISGLKCQPAFILLEGFKDNQGKREQAIKYTADFQYVKGGRQVVEEVKSKATRKARDYSLRRKLFKHRYPDIVFVEVAA